MVGKSKEEGEARCCCYCYPVGGHHAGAGWSPAGGGMEEGRVAANDMRGHCFVNHVVLVMSMHGPHHHGSWAGMGHGHDFFWPKQPQSRLPKGQCVVRGVGSCRKDDVQTQNSDTFYAVKYERSYVCRHAKP